MQGVVARRNNFTEPILKFLEEAWKDFGGLTGRYYGLLTEYRTEDADTVFVSLGSAAENIEAAVDYLRERRGAKVGSIHPNVFRPFPDAAIVKALAGKKNVIILERTDEPMAGDNPMGRDIRTALNKALQGEEGLPPNHRGPDAPPVCGHLRPRLPRFPAGAHDRRIRVRHRRPRAQGRQARVGRRLIHGPWRRPSLRGEVERHAVAAPRQGDRRPLPFRRRLGRHHDRQEPRRDHRRSERPALRAGQGRRRARAIRRKSFTSAPTRSTGPRRRGRRPPTS